LDAYRKLIVDDRTRKKELSYQLNGHTYFISNFRKLYTLFTKYHGLKYNYKDQSFVKRKQKLLKEINKSKRNNTEWLSLKLQAIK